MSFLSTAVQQVLDEGPFCAVATATPRGPHCTPLVFAASGGRIWLTTSRGSVKTRAWKVDPSVSGLVRSGDLSVTFTGHVKTYDALDRGTWGAAVAGATSIARATAKFSKKNARFFAGYALDARQVPLAWTPPGRVFVGIDLERTALLDEDGVQEGRGRWGGEAVSHPTFRSHKQGPDPLAELARRHRGLARAAAGRASLTVAGARGPVSLPARWLAEPSALYAALPAETLALAGAGPDAADGAHDRSSQRMASARHGGRDGAGRRLDLPHGFAGVGREDREGPRRPDSHPGSDALVRLAPSRLVWWKGWSSGSAPVG